jgi:PAS domain S-box-containing protein
VKKARSQPTARLAPQTELVALRRRVREANQVLQAIRAGGVDTVVVPGKAGPQVFTLEGAEHAYRVLIESMNEGALILTADKMILYANHCFARMVRCSLEQVTGSSFGRFLSHPDRMDLRALMKRAAASGSKLQVQLHALDGSLVPAQISVRVLTRQGRSRPTIGMVVTDVTEAQRTEAKMRALTHRVVEVQEAERARVSHELHDNVTQRMCAVLFHSQALADDLMQGAGPAKQKAIQLREILGATASEVERISRYLRPGVLEQLGLVVALRAASADFERRTGVVVKLSCGSERRRLPVAVELALYRIFQEALENVRKHAGASQVAISLTHSGAMVRLVIDDNGSGYSEELHLASSAAPRGLGILGMRERASYAGGTLIIKSGRRAGTSVEVRIPVPLPVAGKGKVAASASE